MRDRVLLEALLAGDAETVRQVQGWIRRASASFRRRLSAEWEDLQQELMVEILGELRRGRWQGGGSLKGLVGRAVVNSCIDRIRYNERWRFVSPELLRSRPDPREREREGYLSALSIAKRMPAECRRLWRMILEGLSYREMSQRVGVREGALRVRVLRCRERAKSLREELESLGSAVQGARV